MQHICYFILFNPQTSNKKCGVILLFKGRKLRHARGEYACLGPHGQEVETRFEPQSPAWGLFCSPEDSATPAREHPCGPLLLSCLGTTSRAPGNANHLSWGLGGLGEGPLRLSLTTSRWCHGCWWS